MKSKARALHDYIAKFGTFPCGHVVEGDGSNVQFSTPKSRRTGKRYWRLRCRICNREAARDGMFLKRLNEQVGG